MFGQFRNIFHGLIGDDNSFQNTWNVVAAFGVIYVGISFIGLLYISTVL